MTSRVTFNTTRSASVCSSVGSYTEASHETNLEIQAEQTHTMCLFSQIRVMTSELKQSVLAGVYNTGNTKEYD